LREEFAPGLVSLALVVVLVLCIVAFGARMSGRVSALRRLRREIARHKDAADFSSNITDLDRRVGEFGRSGASGRVAAAWREFRETLVPHEEAGETIFRNSVRPSAFFNLEDLGFGAGFWRHVPSLFVSVGLFLTFLGLVSALESIAPEDGGTIGSTQLNTLLTVASAKFIMSLTGLLCSIIFTVWLRMGVSRAEGVSHDVSNVIEERLSFVSLEYLAIEQLAAVREQREHFRAIGLELVAELGRPLREDIPNAISASIKSAMEPLLDQVGRAGTEGVGTLVEDLSSRLTNDVGRALTDASDKLAKAGDRISQLSERMDQSSGRVGAELDAAVVRIAQSIDGIRTTLASAAESTGGAFSEGAEKLLSVMNATLEGIRQNTSAGAEAMSAAAADLKSAGEAFREQMDGAVRDGSAAARERIDATGTEIARITSELTIKTERELLSPLEGLAERIGQIAGQIAAASGDFRLLSEGVRAGADASVQAAGTFRTASEDFIAASSPLRATTERIDSSLKHVSEATQNVANTISKSAEATARSAADALAAAQAVLGSEAKAIEAALDGIATLVERMKGQGDRIDDIDVKLGKAFDTYTQQVEGAVDSMRGHVQDLQERLSPALDTLQSVVSQAEQFSPRSRVG